MEQFSLEKYLENPSRKVVTRDGRSVRIICTNRLDEKDVIVIRHLGGHIYQNRDCELDLFFAPEKKSGWINVYRGNGGYNTFVYNRIFATKEEAQKEKRDIIATIKIEWEE